MDIESLRNICRALPHVTEDIKWGNHLCFCIGEKMFRIAGLDEVPVSVSFKTDDADFHRFTARMGFQPAPYLARYKWIHTADISNAGTKEWESIVRKSYELIKAKLPRKILKDIQARSFIIQE